MNPEGKENPVFVEEEAPVETLVETKTTEAPALSKRALKKLKKRQEWLDAKPERKAKEKAKRKAKMEQKRASADYDGESYYASRKRLKKTASEKTKSNVHIVFDMSFDHLMNQKDRGKCLKQLLRCYSMNRRLSHPMHMHVTSFGGRVKEEMGRHDGFENWDCSFHENSYKDVFNEEPFSKSLDNIVYLTSESKNVVGQILEEGFVYVIGGFVDHNLHKGLSHKLALEAKVSHARLPIDEFIEMKTRRVLTIDQVFQILGDVASEGKSWKDAFLTVLPARKGAKEKQ